MTQHVLLLLTGMCEHTGLPRALRAAFSSRADVTFRTHGDVYTSFTSEAVPVGALRAQSSSKGRGPVDKLACALLDAGLTQRCDLAIAVDDLELVNVGHEADVRELFRDALEREAAGLTHAELQRVAQRCSFHLLAPMVEAYFFGEHDAVERALQNAGAPQGTTWSTSGSSVEDFATSDAVYCDRSTSPDLPKVERKGDKGLAWRSANRERHPKHYVEFLCRDTLLGYREGRAGVAALEKLDLPQVLAGGAPLLAELLADVEDALGLPAVLGAGAGPRAPGVLRNL